MYYILVRITIAYMRVYFTSQEVCILSCALACIILLSCLKSLLENIFFPSTSCLPVIRNSIKLNLNQEIQYMNVGNGFLTKINKC